MSFRRCFAILLLISITIICKSENAVDLACRRNPRLSYCKNERRKAPPKGDDDENVPSNPFEDSNPRSSTVDPNFRARFEYESQEIQEETTKLRELKTSDKDDADLLENYRQGSQVVVDRPNQRTITTTLPPYVPNILYTVFPSLQPKYTPYYCPQNQYKFFITCQPARKLRYDLRTFCQDYADQCGVPNINLYPSRHGPPDDGRPSGYGQKQQNGQLGLGRSFSIGLGPVPGFEIVGSQGVDIGSMPYLDQTGGLMVNSGQDLGILGQRIGKGPARAMKSLMRGFPTYNSNSNNDDSGKREQNKALRALGIPSHLRNALSFLAPNSSGPRKKRIGYEPGYGAVNKKSFLATGKTDDDSVIVPGMGEIELVKGIGLGIG